MSVRQRSFIDVQPQATLTVNTFSPILYLENITVRKLDSPKEIELKLNNVVGLDRDQNHATLLKSEM